VRAVERCTNPLLSVRVREIGDALRVPAFTYSKEVTRYEAVLGHDDEVGEKTAARLDHADLTVRYPDQPAMMHVFPQQNSRHV